MKELAQEALDIQGAGNPLGLTKGFASAMDELHGRLQIAGEPHGTDDLCRHPVFKLWALRMIELADFGGADKLEYADAYQACKRLANPERSEKARKYAAFLARLLKGDPP
jgi:hypothetical protein